MGADRREVKEFLGQSGYFHILGPQVARRDNECIRGGRPPGGAGACRRSARWDNHGLISALCRGRRSMTRVFTCPRGHRWQASLEETTTCPECGSPSQSLAESLTTADSYAPVDLLPPRPQLTPGDIPLPLEENQPRPTGPAPGGWPAIPGYEILAERARGGMGVVYRARQISLNRVVALKMILTGAHAAPKEVARFRAEAEAVARFQHPNIVGVHDVGEHDGRPYMALEFVEGHSLAQELDGAPLSPQPSARLVEMLARAVHYAHERGIIHRDLKPANVLLQSDFTAGQRQGEERRQGDRETRRTSGRFCLLVSRSPCLLV
jgi:hypothetical protein